MHYPVLDIVEDLKLNLLKSKIVILQAPPGAGKSTILPLQLLNEAWLGNKKIVMLEPRKLAARSVALRMASLLEQEIGGSVGYRVRFETRVSDRTKIEVVTEGILTRMVQNDNSLEEVGLLIFDEFHERSLHADLALALSLQVQQVLRDDLRILIMSATMDTERLSSLLQGSPVVKSLGKQFPVTIQYNPGEQNSPLAFQVSKAIRKAYYEQSGDILVFLPGAGEILRTAELLSNESIDAEVYPLFGDLPFKKQQEAILPHPSGRRKVVLATSIAETSLTIEGISVVIDSGFSRVPRFDPRSGLTRLETIRVTKDAADQRAGRAGRLGPGVCYRLWSEGVQANLVPNRSPEILEADLAPLLLELSEWGVKNVNDLTWITPPPIGAINQATDLLTDLEALSQGLITTRGKAMVKLPTHPRIAHMLLEAADLGKADLALATDVAALLEERDPLNKLTGADLTLRIDALRKWRSGERVNADQNALERIEKVAFAWRKAFKIAEDNSSVADTSIGRLVHFAYPERVAKQTGKNSTRYKLANGRVANLPEHDPLLRESWLSIAHLDAGVGEGRIFLAAPLSEDDLMALAVEKETVKWDDSREMVVANVEHCIGNLVLQAKPLLPVPQEKSIGVICDVVRDRGLKIFDWNESHSEWQARVMSLKLWRPEEEWPDVSEENLLKTADEWLSPFLTSVTKRSDLQRLDLQSILSSILPWSLASKLDSLAPPRLSVPSGSMIKIRYSSHGEPPVMEVRLQEVFGLVETPTVNEGRTKIILHLLSPGFKPVQVTQDLKSFWSSTYAEVRKELRMRYPKHSWPEDPWTAEAVRGAKKRTN